MSAGIAGNDFRSLGSLARDCEMPSPPRSLWAEYRLRPTIRQTTQEDALVCSGWKARQRTSLAVQQQRFEPDSNAD
jgi:hypothetical protein